jgi:hypothetical protein
MGQVVDLPTSGKLENAKFKDMKEDESYLRNPQYYAPGSSKRDDGTGSYSFRSGPPITSQERGGSGQEYEPAEFKAITAPPVLSLAPGRIVELEDGDALGGDGGRDAPGAPGGTGSAPSGGNDPAPVPSRWRHSHRRG